MISFKSDIGNQRIFIELGQLDNKTRKAIRQTWFRVGKDLHKEASNEILHGVKTGRIYLVKTKGGRRRRHRASAPGETHANLRGKLRRSISWAVHGAESMDFGYGVSTTAANKDPDYAAPVELGSKNAKARPSLANAIHAGQRKAQQHFEKAMMQEFKR